MSEEWQPLVWPDDYDIVVEDGFAKVRIPEGVVCDPKCSPLCSMCMPGQSCLGEQCSVCRSSTESN